MDITDSTLGPGNVASGNSDFTPTGGAIDNDDGSLYVSDSTINSGNTAGGGTLAPVAKAVVSPTNHPVAIRLDNLVVRHDRLQHGRRSDAEGGDLWTNTNDPMDSWSPTRSSPTARPPTVGDCYPSANDFISEGYNLTDGIDSTGVADCGFTGSTDLLGDARLGPWRTTAVPPRPRRWPPAAPPSTRS